MAKLLILGPSFRRNPDPNPLPALERYDGLFYRIVRKYSRELEKKGIDVIIVTEDLEVVTPETKLPYKPPAGDKWRSLPPASRDAERVERLRRHLLELLEGKRYEEVFVALNRHYQALLPDLAPYSGKVLTRFKGIGPKAEALKKWLEGDVHE